MKNGNGFSLLLLLLNDRFFPLRQMLHFPAQLYQVENQLMICINRLWKAKVFFSSFLLSRSLSHSLHFFFVFIYSRLILSISHLYAKWSLFFQGLTLSIKYLDDGIKTYINIVFFFASHSPGVLVVNVTWRGKTYVGTLLDSTKQDWACPR